MGAKCDCVVASFPDSFAARAVYNLCSGFQPGARTLNYHSAVFEATKLRLELLKVLKTDTIKVLLDQSPQPNANEFLMENKALNLLVIEELFFRNRGLLSDRPD